VLVLQECDRQSGLLFDSDSRRRPRERVLARQNATRIDGRLLHEMLFGAVPLSMNGVTTKLHLVPQSRQIMVSKLCRVQFVPPPPPERVDGAGADDDDACAGAHVPHDASFKKSVAVAVLFDNALPAPRKDAGGGDDYADEAVAAAGSASGASDADSIHLRRFIESHFALIDFHLNAFCRGVVSNLRHRYDQQCLAARQPQAPLFEMGALQNCKRLAFAVQRLGNELHTLATRERLYVRAAPSAPRQPFALSDEAHRAELFIGAVRRLARYDSSANDFFLSTLVTALLTYNHSWLNVLEHTALLGDAAQCYALPTGGVDTLTHQLRGLFGHWHGDPARQEHTCRTVVRGGERHVIESLLTVVGYFVRGVELRVSEHAPPLPPLFSAEAAKRFVPDAAVHGVQLLDIRSALPRARAPDTPATSDDRLVDLRFSMVGGYAEPTAPDAPAPGGDSGAPPAPAPEGHSDAFSALVVSGISADVSLRQVRRSLAMQLRATVDLPLLPTFSDAKHSRAAFCLLADVDSKMCELLSCTAPPHHGIGVGVLASNHHRQHQLQMSEQARQPAERARRMSASALLSDGGEFDDAEAEHGGNEIEDTQRYGVQRTRLLPSEHIATTLGELRELAALALPATALCAYLDQRIAMLVALARVVATQLHGDAAAHSGDEDGASLKGEALRAATAAAERTALACGVAPTDVPLVATIAQLCGARWK
jgi:hypothetical protein